jgi:hypothetical protein
MRVWCTDCKSDVCPHATIVVNSPIEMGGEPIHINASYLYAMKQIADERYEYVYEDGFLKVRQK